VCESINFLDKNKSVLKSIRSVGNGSPRRREKIGNKKEERENEKT